MEKLPCGKELLMSKAHGKYVDVLRETMKEKRPVQYRELSKSGQLEEVLQKENYSMSDKYWEMYERIYEKRRERGEEPDPNDLLAMTRFKNQIRMQVDEILKASL